MEILEILLLIILGWDLILEKLTKLVYDIELIHKWLPI